jgi:hypothetical protein
MPNRAIKRLAAIVFSAILSSFLAGFTHDASAQTAINAETAVETNVEAAKDCLVAPEGQTGPGEHWYYRIERGTNRHCWYIKGAGQAVARAAPPVVKPVAPPVPAPLQPSVADARAEVTPAPEVAQPTANPFPDPLAATAVADAGSNDGAAPAGPQVSPPRGPAEQLPDQPSANNPAEGMPSNAVASIRRHLRPSAAKRAGYYPADDSIWMLLSALGGALALVALATGIAKFGRGSLSRRKRRDRSRHIWDERPVRVAPSVASAPPIHNNDDDVPMDWIRTARATQEAKRRGEEVERLLSRRAAPRRSAV